jgi:hypothetical protein
VGITERGPSELRGSTMQVRDVRHILDAICNAQRGDGLGDIQPATPFLVAAFYVGRADLEQIRPHLTSNPDQPDLGQAGRYGDVAVFPLEARGVTDLPCALLDGVWFEYASMDVVD